jgi:aminopeptidase N
MNAIEHAALTAPLFERALSALPMLKRRHKIFFVGSWLSAFIAGQDAASARDMVRGFAARPGLDADLRLKLLEFNDALERTVRIRERFAP